MKWTNEDVVLVEKFIDIKNKGFYCDGGQLTEVYNRVLEKSAPPTNCGSCMRQRISELEGALNQFKKTLEVKEEEQPKKTNKGKKKEEAFAPSFFCNMVGSLPFFLFML